MKSYNVLVGISFFIVVSVGCSNSNLGPVATKYDSNTPYPDRKSSAWCQDNYFSASVSTRERQSNAKYCDEESRGAFLEAKQKQESNK